MIKDISIFKVRGLLSVGLYRHLLIQNSNNSVEANINNLCVPAMF